MSSNLDSKLRYELPKEMKWKIGTVEIPNPVSYTHLDVYKRQGEGPGRPACSGEGNEFPSWPDPGENWCLSLIHILVRTFNEGGGGVIGFPILS